MTDLSQLKKRFQERDWNRGFDFFLTNRLCNVNFLAIRKFVGKQYIL